MSPEQPFTQPPITPTYQRALPHPEQDLCPEKLPGSRGFSQRPLSQAAGSMVAWLQWWHS